MNDLLHLREDLAFKNLMFRIKENHGFMNEKDLEILAKVCRLHPVLVRCGGGRFTCPAQDAEHFIEIIGKEGRDYVRDVSLPA